MSLIAQLCNQRERFTGGSLYISDTTYGKNYSCYPALSEKMNASGRVLLLASQCSGTREVSWGSLARGLKTYGFTETMQSNTEKRLGTSGAVVD